MKVYELDTNKLIFEGEYKNATKNGKGREYDDNGKIIFEGEYSNGKRINGVGYDDSGYPILILSDKIGKEYYKNGGIKFEGEYINDKRWNGKFYDYNGNEIFEIKKEKDMEKNIIIMVNLYMMENMLMGKEMGKVKGIIMMIR